MLVSLQWLREFTPYQGTVQDLADRLTMQGLEVEAILDPFEAIADIVVGHVVQCAPHPESDHLSVTSVDVGGPELLQIVCGAPNVAAGQKVPVALVGTTMPGETPIAVRCMSSTSKRTSTWPQRKVSPGLSLYFCTRSLPT